MIEQLNKYIDHTVLKPTTSNADIEKLCNEAITYDFVAVCVPQSYVKKAHQLLEHSATQVATVIGFPFGYNTINTKLLEIETALNDGADEIDIVQNLTAVVNNDWEYIEQEIKLCTQLVHQSNKKIKVIIESGILSDEQIIHSTEICNKYDVDFVKTSTGYAEVGATAHAVALMKAHISKPHIGIKASGGVRTLAFAEELIQLGATRIGTSSGINLVNEAKV